MEHSIFEWKFNESNEVDGNEVVTSRFVAAIDKL